MMKKLVVVLMAAFFSFSVAGLSFADEKKPGATPAAPVATGAPAQPCAGKEMPKKKAKKKAAKKKEMAQPCAPAPAAAPAPTGK